MKNEKVIIGISGLIGSGKDTVADYLVNTHSFQRISFAGVIKDIAASIFGWDRSLLEGRTKASREWREQIDPWWANKLNMSHFTPRWVLQNFGTELFRNHFHPDIWIHSVEHKLMNSTDNIVISDVRFPNEIKSIRESGGLIIRTHRGPDPQWYQDAVDTNAGISQSMKFRSDVHPSEWAWIGTEFDAILDNDGTIDDLYSQINRLLNPQSST